MSLSPLMQRWKDDIVPGYPPEARRRLLAMSDAELVRWYNAQIRYNDYDLMAADLKLAGCDEKEVQRLVLMDMRTKVAGIFGRMAGWAPEYEGGGDFDLAVATEVAAIDAKIATLA